MDVDTDSNSATLLGDGLGGVTDDHTHTYDDVVNRTYVDYLDIHPLNNGLFNITEVGIGTAPPEEFIVLMANADLSPGSDLTIGAKSYNVVTYQRMIQKKLAAWDGVGPLVDDAGVSFIHTLNSIKAGGGTLRSTFDSMAFISGGLHPTQTGCVKNSPNITNGRWRNGALIIQLIKRSHFGAGLPKPLDRVTVQNPTDLKSIVVLADGSQVDLTEDLNANSIIEGNAPNYEAYGGLLVSNDAEFLYESTLFWHYDGVCYGDPAWVSGVQGAMGPGNAQELFDEQLAEAGFADLIALEAQIALLEACVDEKVKDGGCKDQEDYFDELEDLLKLGKKIAKETSVSTLPPTTGPGTISGAPVIIEGGVAEGGVTSGPNFQTGRRTWIDILPK